MKRQSAAIGFAVYTDMLERLDCETLEYDVDTVLIYDETETLDAVMQAAAQLRKTASVLVAKDAPKNMTYRTLMKLQNGEVVTIYENG